MPGPHGVTSPLAPHIALDARPTRRMSVGMLAYASELATRLPRVAPDLRFTALTRGENFGFDEQIRMPLDLLRIRADFTHHLSVYAPLFTPTPFAITIHDLIHLRYPEMFKRSVGPYYQTIVRWVCARAARVITDDERTVYDLQHFLGVPREKVRVIALGADDRYFRDDIEPESPERPFFLYAGNHRPHKDLPTLLTAWASLPEECEIDLYLTGEDDLPDEQRVTRARGTLRFLGDTSNERLARLYRSCTALVHPALCEGFGLPMLEALAVGARVLACEDAAPAVLGSFVECFPARDVGALRALMERALDGEGDAARDVRRSFASKLTWDQCARATAEVYREVLAECRR